MENNNFYVYTHSVDGIVFYIGKGVGDRYKSKQHRNSIWNGIVEHYGFNNIKFDIIIDNLDELVAEALEKKEILSNKPNYILCNKQINHSKKDIDLELLHKNLQYSENSPSGLVRRISAGNQGAGSIAGTLNPKGYWGVRLGPGGTFYAHRLVWALHYGDIEGNMTIDHIDGNRANNILSNLRVCTMDENNKYREERAPLRKSNSSGIPGITEHSNGRSSLYARVQYTIEGKRYRKDFSYHKLGKEAAWVAAFNFKSELHA